jgi:hypothetical protein
VIDFMMLYQNSYIALNGTMIDELERIWKEAEWPDRGENEEKRKYFRRASVPADIRTQHLPYESRALPLRQPARHNECVTANAVKQVASGIVQGRRYPNLVCGVLFEVMSQHLPGETCESLSWFRFEPSTLAK